MTDVALIAFFACFVLVFILRMPMPLGMIACCAVYFLISGDPIKMVAQQTLKSFYFNPTIIAVPLFIFAANIMNEGKITEKVFGFAKCFVGHLRGGLAQVNVLASLVFSGMTGSAIADASGLGKMEIDAMRKEGYDDGFSCAITAASATIGPIFPPSIPLVMYAMLSDTSVGALFMGGMVPGVLLAVFLMFYVAFVSRRRNYPRSEKMQIAQIANYLLSSIPAILTPVILLVGIYTGVMTPNEAGAVAGLYALIVAAFGYRIISWSGIKKAILDTVEATGSVALMIGSAQCVSYIVARTRIAEKLTSVFISSDVGTVTFLLLVNLLILILGMVVDSSTIMLVFVPIVLPVAVSLGIDLIHFGVLVCFGMMIGLSTPPFGMLLFITSGISGTPLKTVIKETMPMVIVMFVELFILILIPDVVLAIPKLFMGY